MSFGGRNDRLGNLARENAIEIVQLTYRARPYEGRFKDCEFSRQAMVRRLGAFGVDGGDVQD